MPRRFLRVLVSIPMIAALLPILATTSIAHAEKVGELYRVNAMVPGTVGPGATANVDIKINRWSTEEEEDELRLALQQSGPQGLHKAMKRQKKTGFIAIRGQHGYPTYYSQEFTENGKRTILILTDREIEFEEVYNREISLQFPFTMITMALDSEGNGQGAAILGAELKWDEANDVLRVTGYSAEPVRLEGVRLISKK